MLETDVFDMIAVNHLIGRHVARLRSARGLSVDALGIALGLSPVAVLRIENGTNAVTAARLKQIADVLAEPIQSFFSPSTLSVH